MKKGLSFLANTPNIWTSGEVNCWEKQNIAIKFINKFSMTQELIGECHFPQWASCIVEKNWCEYKTFDLELVYNYYHSIEQDAFEIDVCEKRIEIRAKNRRGIFYAMAFLGNCFEQDNTHCYLPCFQTRQVPKMKIRGLIEGFYGTPWTAFERMDMISMMANQRMNTYFYAPKDDVYHRKDWRVAYPKEKLEEIIQLKVHCDSQFIDFYYGISPGNDIDYTSEEDMLALLEKLETVIEFGVSRIMILLDDIPYELEGKSKQYFRRSGIAHATLVQKIDQFLQEKLSVYDLIICPTEYWQNYDSEYRRDLAEHLPSDVYVWWTGYNTIAKQITCRDARAISKVFSHKLLLWDNVPVNDLARDKGRIFIAPYYSRCTDLEKNNHIGIVMNPLIEAELSKISLIQMANFMWDSHNFNPYRQWEKAITSYFSANQQHWKTILENFGNHHIYNPIHPDIRMALHQKSKSGITAYFEKLSYALDTICERDNKAFYQQFKPWLNQLSADCQTILTSEKNQDGVLLRKEDEQAKINGYHLEQLLEMMKEL